jgi:hypothetical protein
MEGPPVVGIYFKLVQGHFCPTCFQVSAASLNKPQIHKLSVNISGSKVSYCIQTAVPPPPFLKIGIGEGLC